jgi:hypothetical protein
MVITETQVKEIIKEEITRMISEGEIDESWFSDAIGGVGKRAAGRFAKAAGLSSAELANQEKSAAAEKTAAQAKGVSKIKEKAQKEVASIAKEISKELIKIQTEKFDELEKAARFLRYDKGVGLDLSPIKDNLDLVMMGLEEVMDDVEGRYARSAETGHYDPVKTLSEKKK